MLDALAELAELAEREELLIELGDALLTDVAECELDSLCEDDSPTSGSSGTFAAGASPMITVILPEAQRPHTACRVRLPHSTVCSIRSRNVWSFVIDDGLESRKPCDGASASFEKPISKSSVATLCTQSQRRAGFA